MEKVTLIYADSIQQPNSDDEKKIYVANEYVFDSRKPLEPKTVLNSKFHRQEHYNYTKGAKALDKIEMQRIYNLIFTWRKKYLVAFAVLGKDIKLEDKDYFFLAGFMGNEGGKIVTLIDSYLFNDDKYFRFQDLIGNSECRQDPKETIDRLIIFRKLLSGEFCLYDNYDLPVLVDSLMFPNMIPSEREIDFMKRYGEYGKI